MIVVAVVVDRAKLPGAFTAISFVKPNTYLTCDGTVSPWRRAKETALAQKGRYRWASGFTSHSYAFWLTGTMKNFRSFPEDVSQCTRCVRQQGAFEEQQK